MIKNSISSDGRGRLFIRFLIFVLILSGLGITFYRPALVTVFSAVLQRNDSSIGLFVPIFSGYILWRRFAEIKQLPLQANWLSGLLVTLTGIILFFLSKYTEYFLILAVLSLLCISGGLILLLFGSAIFKKTAFPLFFLVTMTPIPLAIYAAIAEQIRLSSTWGAVKIARFLGVELYRDDFYIHLSQTTLFVADSCSGIRYFFSYFVCLLFYAAGFKQTMVGRLVVMLGFIPLALLAGMVRIATIILAAHYISPTLAEYRPHVVISWSVFLVFLVGFVSLDRYLSKAR
ncbi:exosortase/archaeosortase family protein [Desulfopila sp. IMCC35006]|uniref:exosortase/archaeosortase family protein n=1 Tax=Desulfopila sp. IMCC35006 TaxID=2569542 RepID=UPI0010ABEFC1|nr:exosortase/archaeosortase family protein [Desulfopila sp. IMCC35006]TKB25005.1 exosortase/archaeosortase family protein [Desulfopila sp. IMCC35006]